MKPYRLEIHVTPRPGLLDPQGNAIHHTLRSLGFDSVDRVRVGKAIYVDLEAASAEEAKRSGEAMCAKILANPVTEDYAVEVLREGAGAAAEAGSP